MKTKLVFAVFAIALFFLAGCSAPSRTLQAGQFVLKPDESITSDDGSTKLTFLEVSEDSRCPTNVQCVWAGQVKVLIEVTLGTEIQQYTLVTVPAFEGDLSSIEFGDYTVTLTQVDPYPVHRQVTDPADYRATLDIVEN
jgi:hypothetical protein